MLGYYSTLFSSVLLIIIAERSNAALDSFLLTHYDLKIRKSEATCRLVNHFNLPQDRRTLAGRDCMCDEECVLYKDCCKDSRYYRSFEQSQPPSHHCSETTGVYLLASCSPNWKDDEVEQNCNSSVEPLESDDLSLILPISNQKTRNVFGNRHCAVCNHDLDRDSWVQFPLGVACGEAPPGFLKYDPAYSYTYTTSTFERDNNLSMQALSETNVIEKTHVANNVIRQPYRGFVLDVHLYVTSDSDIKSGGNILQLPIQLQTVDLENSSNFARKKRQSFNQIDFRRYSTLAEKICSSAKYDPYNKEFVSRYTNKYFICRFGAVLPENAENFTRRCVPFLERQCPHDFKDETIKEECAIHTKIVYNKQTGKPYRNSDCARCNGEKEDAVDGKPQDTRDDFSVPAAGGQSDGVDGTTQTKYGKAG